ncbi:MAG: NUDIX hydrolase [Planctomycetota bacterium]
MSDTMQKTETQTVYRGNRIDIERHTFVDASGREVTKEIGRHVGACCVLAMPDPDHVVLIRNRRAALDDVLWELPAGTLEPPEPPIETAKRELVEEAGFVAGHIEPLLTFWTAPGLWDEKMHAFLATDLTPAEQALEAGEEIEPHVLPYADALDLIRTGDLVDGKSMTTLLWYDRFRRQK